MTARSNIGCQASDIRQNGFALVSAIFILVVLAGLGSAMVSISTSQHTTVAMDVQSTRAYQAAHAGIEWGAYQVLQVANACPVSPAALTFTGTPLAGFTTTVTCSVTAHAEGSNTVSLYAFTATAIYGSAGSSDYIEREAGARIARCVDSGGAAC